MKTDPVKLAIHLAAVEWVNAAYEHGMFPTDRNVASRVDEARRRFDAALNAQPPSTNTPPESTVEPTDRGWYGDDPMLYGNGHAT